MYKHKWAAIIYGRSYHLDFRLITIPQDFTDREKDWASQYILDTFSHANKLSSHPRWSLLKNDTHCVVGVTCMVRDLLINQEQELIESLSKDNCGRPLYVFVGYVTQLNRRKRLLDFPAYSDFSLQAFQELYQYILQVWWVEEYYKDSKKPIFNDYQLLDFANQNFKTNDILEIIKQINHQEKHPDLTYLWHNTPEQKRKLWVASAISYEPISICLGDQELKNIINTPFLNQTVTCESTEVIEGCAIEKIQNNRCKVLPTSSILPTKNTLSTPDNLSQVITKKVKEDIEITLHHANLVKNKSRDLLQNISDRSLLRLSSSKTLTDKNKNEQKNNFGLRLKSSLNKDGKEQWF
jgi:hypothetical protein